MGLYGLCGRKFDSFSSDLHFCHVTSHIFTYLHILFISIHGRYDAWKVFLHQNISFPLGDLGDLGDLTEVGASIPSAPRLVTPGPCPATE